MFKKQTSLTSDSVAGGMLTFAIPIFLSNLFQQLYNAVDSLIVGNFLGGQALAAVGSSGSLIFLLTGFVNGVSLGAGVLVARYYGARDGENLKKPSTPPWPWGSRRGWCSRWWGWPSPRRSCAGWAPPPT